MKTVNVRLLVADDVDEELLVAQLVTQTSGAGAPLGAVRLRDEDFEVGRDPVVHVRLLASRITWNGLPCGPRRPAAPSSTSDR